MEYIALEQLAAYAESTGRTLPVTGTVSARWERRSLLWTLQALRRREHRFSAGPTEITEAQRWLLDNLWLAEGAAQEARRALRTAGRLRRCREGALLFALCRVLLSAGGGAADEERCAAFLRGFQRKTVLRWQELRLFPAALGAAAVELLSAEYARPEPDPRRAGALFTTLRRLSAWDMGELLESADAAGAYLRRDPARVYSRMDESSRHAYRREVERLARRFRLPEYRVAEKALELSLQAREERRRHIGYYLLEDPLGRGERRRSGALYVAVNAALPVLLAALGGALLRSVRAGLLLWLPLTQLVKELLDTVLLRIVPPRHVPRLELREGVPPEGRTLCVISVLLTGEKGADAAVRHLEEYRMASRDCGEHLLFGLLCDLPEADEAYTRADRALLERAAAGVEALNQRYGGGFYLFGRERVWSADTEKFSGWERKRGAVTELCRLLAGESSALELGAGDRLGLRGVAYVLTLDSDTRLEPEAARALIGAALHPLNRPAVDAGRRIVTEGHGVLHPRIAVGLEAAVRTPFARLFAPQGGGDPYGSDAGEVYMDAFASGGFAGKGLIHVGAFLRCLGDRFPDNLVLSHDALEGAFLRGGYVSDVELTDGFPAAPMSWFSRQHRWVRGDWQNLPWLFRAGRDLPLMERWRLYDSLRRSLVPPAVMAAAGAWLFAGTAALGWAALTALLAILLPYLQMLLRVPFRSRKEAPLRVRARVLHGPGEELARPLGRLVLLPFEAWSSLSAAVTALWRLWVSRKRRLQWQTAEQSEAGAAPGLLALSRRMWSSVTWGVLLLGFAGTVLGRAAGAVWLAAPLLALGLGKPRPSAGELAGEDRDWLLRRGAEIWRYFREECGPETHFLPPDNVQLSPAAAKAERVSPTNLGLTLIAALSALELGLAGEGEALGVCENVIAAAERMERWEGHFYNWYDTRTLSPLAPAYVSTVDSGNLYGCLLTAAALLRARGAATLAARAEALYMAMDFRPLYDEKRCLFRIGVAPGEETGAESWYDLLESEERLTGYIAVAAGQVPKKHWQRLGRAQVGCDGFRGMVSWSGTMFEYLMPELFLPLYPDSHLGESARFAVYVQRKRAAGPHRLWGMSESAFYSLDASLHYRYKAHGCPRLALSRETGEERVVAPYAGFLALMVSPRPALENLKNMESAGLLGPYGFWEAVDFTLSRVDGGEGAAVRCVMAHHLGMSLAAIANTLCDGVLRRAFLSDAAMAAYTGLLQEKVPLGGALLRRRERRAPARSRTAAPAVLCRGEGTDFLCPGCAALSNGVYHLRFSESGVSAARCGALQLYRNPRFPWEEEGHGIELTLRREGESLSLLPRPGDGVEWRWEFTAGEAVLHARRDDLRWSVTAAVSRRGTGEWRSVTLHRGENAPAEELILSFEPVLLPEKDARAHPSFGRLGLFTRARDGVLSVRRLARGKQAEQFLALAADREAAFSSDLRRFPGRNGGEAFVPNTGWQCEPYLAVRTVLPAGERESAVRFALALAGGEEAATAAAADMLRAESGFPMALVCARRWKMEERELARALERLRGISRPCLCREAAAGETSLPRDALWKLGISGDLPIHGVECAGAEAVSAGAEELRLHGVLAACGAEYDLVFLTADGGDYRRTVRAELERELEKMGLGDTAGTRGGVHFASLSEDGEAVRSAAALWTGPAGLALPARRTDRTPRMPAWKPAAVAAPRWAFGEDDEVSFTLSGALPPRAWSNVLTNGALGWLATDALTGPLWYKNARECPLIPWTGDPLAVSGPEQLWAELDGGPVSFSARPGEETRVTFGFGTAAWEKTVQGVTLRLTAFIPPERGVRVFLLESSAPCTVSWCAPLQMAAETEDASGCVLCRKGEALRACNPRCPLPGVTLTARCSVPWESVGTDAAAFLFGEGGETPRSGTPALAGIFRLEGTAVLLCGTEDAPELLDAAAAGKALADTRRWWARRLLRFRAEGPERELLPLVNGWSAYQALAGRVLGRASLYQSGGAIGFRDQLQDYVNLLPLDAPGCRAHILACCAHQFEEGDVQHWWHPGVGETDKGVRTRCSDDLLWLPWAVCEYVTATGDETLLTEEAPFLAAAPLSPGENSRYETPALSGSRGSVLEHCRRSVALALRRGVGAHRLLYMGGGDWNDGFDAMGEGAESVWLTFFCSEVCRRFGALLERAGDGEAEKYARTAEMLGRAANDTWDGDRYLRGWYADGTPLGAGDDSVCRIDSVAQSFAAFCPWADPDRVRTALDTALRELWDREGHLLRLYAPAVGPADRSPGYVRTYGPGFRENGGQYTHAAVWLARACFRTGRWAEGTALLRDIVLAMREDGYGAEPYVLPADVSAAEGMEGRAGWTWYTGAAGWWYRTALEDMLGLSLRDGRAVIAPPPEAAKRGWTLREEGKNS